MKADYIKIRVCENAYKNLIIPANIALWLSSRHRDKT